MIPNIVLLCSISSNCFLYTIKLITLVDNTYLTISITDMIH